MIRSIAVLVLVVATSFTRAQDDPAPTPPPPDAVTVELLQQRIAAFAESEPAAAEVYRETIALLERIAAAREREAKNKAEAAAAPERLETIRSELQQPAPPPTPEVPADATLAQLEQREAEVIANLASARNLVSELQAEATRRQDRRTQIPEALAQLRQAVAELEARPLPTAPESALAEARVVAQLAERRALLAEIDALEAELSSYNARRDLLPARRDLAARRVTQAEQLADAWRAIIGQRRKIDAEATAREAERLRRETARQHPALQAFAQETARLAAQRTEAGSIPSRIARSSEMASQARAQFDSLRQRYFAVRQRLEASGLNRATGLLLRREFESLPDIDSLSRRLRATQRELEEIEYILFERQESRVGSDDINNVAQQLLAQIGPVENATADELAVTRDLAAARRDILAELENDADRYQDVLVDLSVVGKRLLEAATAYESFIQERILWVRSITKDRPSLIDDLTEAGNIVTDRQAWSEAFGHIWADIKARFPTSAVVIAALSLLVAASRWSRRKLQDLADLVKRFRTDHLAHTFAALGCTALAASPVPAFIWWAGWLLARPLEQVAIVASLGYGLQMASGVVFVLMFVRQSIGANRLAEAHFRWAAETLRPIRRHLRWLTPIFAVATAGTFAVDHFGDEVLASSLGRASFTLSMLALSSFAALVLKPTGPLVAALEPRFGGWLSRLRVPLYLVIVAAPLALVAIAWAGYYYTSLQLQLRLERTTILALGLILFNALLMRWLFLARRRVAVEGARRRREQTLAEESQRVGDAPLPTESSAAPVDEDQVDLPAMSAQTRQLFRTSVWIIAAVGLFAIWADVLPALRMLDRVEVYPHIRVVESLQDDRIPLFEAPTSASLQQSPSNGTAPQRSGDQTAPNGSAATVSPNPLSAISSGVGSAASDATLQQAENLNTPTVITLSHVGVAIVVLIATILAFRNLPGLVEFLVLQRLPLDAGSRYALSTILRYIIATVGLLAAFAAIDISWSSVQWLAAALTFGLAFGLQEIFANFISGLIILGERPIRIGDTVTIGSINGTVTRIKMRATTITDWERKELIIPNKTFITGDVINWTLSDPTLRLTVAVGVGYGEDVKKAEAILLKLAQEHPLVLEDPKPYVVFGGFGDSTLDFQLRVFIPHIDHLLTVRHDMHMQVILAFREANIEIAFPQRDLHIRSIAEPARLLHSPQPPSQSDAQTHEPASTAIPADARPQLREDPTKPSL